MIPIDDITMMKQPFPPSTPLYPPAATVLKYLESYAAHFELNPDIKYNTLIKTIRWDSDRHHWDVNLDSGEVETFDCVIVANGR